MEGIMGETIHVSQRGTITLPADLRAKYGIKPGDKLYLMDLDGVFVLAPVAVSVSELAREIDRLRREAGLSIEDLLTGLREQRERYGDADSITRAARCTL
jgi:AbrB family looped-hinge helix DNA binding protein